MKKAYLVIESLLAAALFVVFATGMVIAVIGSWNANRMSKEQITATHLASEGIEAARSIRNQSYATFASPTGPVGVANSVGNLREWVGTNNTFDAGRYTRTITVEAVNRDGSGNIVPAPTGTVDTNTQKVTSTVSWNFSAARPADVSLSTYFTNWKAAIVSARGGILVYGDGGTTTDAMKYRVLDSAGTWGVVQTFPDFDSGTTNKALRVIRVFSSATRNEKIAISRHYNGSAQFIYSHVYNGATWTSTQLSTWTAATFLDVHNFDGAYLSNGNFVVVYSDNTTTPKTKTWNGTSWTVQGSSVNMKGIPNNTVLKNRLGTNELVLATFDQSSDTNTSYFNGTTWASAVEHSTTSPLNTKEFVDFTWSAQNSGKGGLIYASGANDTSMQIKICTAPCTTAAGWSAAGSTTAQGTLGAMEMDPRKGVEEYLACNKDASNDIYCFRSSSTGAFTDPTNRIITATTDTDIQRSFDLEYEPSTGDEGLIVYSDTTSIPKLKKYTASTNTFDAAATNMSTLNAALKMVKMRSSPTDDDVMIMMGDGSVPPRFYTTIWDGLNNVVYTTPTGKAFTAQGTNGSNAIEYWFGFAWDNF